MNLPTSRVVQEAFEFADQDRTILQFRWQTYKSLFKTSGRRLELLNDSGSTFFVDLQRMLIDTIVLGICRMLDPAFSWNRENTTLSYLIDVLKKDGHHALANKLEAKLLKINTTAKCFGGTGTGESAITIV